VESRSGGDRLAVDSSSVPFPRPTCIPSGASRAVTGSSCSVPEPTADPGRPRCHGCCWPSSGCSS